MSVIGNIGKIAYIYNQQTDTWHPIAGMTDTSSNFVWTGTHEFDATTRFDGAITANAAITTKGPINYFASTSARDAAIPSPTNGVSVFVVNDGVLQHQTYYSGSWNVSSSNANLVEKTANYTIALSDSGKTLDFNSSSALSITIPLDSAVNFPVGSQIAFIQSGEGKLSFSGQTSELVTVAINSKNNNKRTAARYTQALLVKKAANSWYLFGDLTA
jgi:hypothetical protein